MGGDVLDALLDVALVGLEEFHQRLKVTDLSLQGLDFSSMAVELLFQHEQLLLEDLDVFVDKLVGLLALVLAKRKREAQDKREDPRQASEHQQALIFR